MPTVRTHLSHSDGSIADDLRIDVHEYGFLLSAVNNRSFNFKVDDKAVSLLVWGLLGDDVVEVRRARVGSTGSTEWTLSSCGLPVSPSLGVCVGHMPYVKNGKPVVLNAENPHVVIDDVGAFFLVYHGDNETVVELLPDVLANGRCNKG